MGFVQRVRNAVQRPRVSRRVNAVVAAERTTSDSSRTQARLFKVVAEEKLAPQRRYRMRGPTGTLLAQLDTIQAKIASLQKGRNKRLAWSTFLQVTGFPEIAFPLFIDGLLKGGNAKINAEEYAEKHKNHPRVSLFLAQLSTGQLRRYFLKYASQELMARKFVRIQNPRHRKEAGKHLKQKLSELKVEFASVNGARTAGNSPNYSMKVNQALKETFEWALQKGFVGLRLGEKWNNKTGEIEFSGAVKK